MFHNLRSITTIESVIIPKKKHIYHNVNYQNPFRHADCVLPVKRWKPLVKLLPVVMIVFSLNVICLNLPFVSFRFCYPMTLQS